MFCCFTKILYYFLLNIYHGCDIVVDGLNFLLVLKNGTFAGVPIPANITVDFAGLPLTLPYLFGFSCVVGTVCSVIMIWVYCRFIRFHWRCIDHPSFAYHAVDDVKISMAADLRYCDDECTRHFVLSVTLELWISVLELLCKDDIQSGLLYWSYSSGFILPLPSWRSMAFWMPFCSVIAHLKLLLCFLTKLCGHGVGEREHCSHCTFSSFAKMLACIIGIIGSVLCLYFTFKYLGNALPIDPFEPRYSYINVQ